MNYYPWAEEWLEAVCQLWNGQWAERFPMRSELLRQNSLDDPHLLREGSWVAVDELSQKPVGVVIAKCWREADPVDWGKGTGWIQALLVDQPHRGRGIGSALLKRAEAALAQKQVEKIALGSDWWHYFPGVPEEEREAMAWLERRGYQAGGPQFDLLATWPPALPADQPPQTGEVSFRVALPQDRERLLTFLHRAFPGRWEYEALCYFEKGGTGREYVLAEKQGAIIGFCRINDARSPLIAQNVYWAPLFSEELGGIGPVGVDQAERKHGYGLAVVQAGVYFLRKRGIRTICIDWTDLVAFYGKLGFQVWKGYRAYHKAPIYPI